MNEEDWRKSFCSISSLNSNTLNNANKNDNSFANMLNNSIKEVNNEQLEGYKAMEGIASGKVPNLQQAVQQIEEAELSLKLALEIKNKAIGSYKEIMKIQV